MKHKLLALLLCLLAVPVALPAQTSFVNLTPKPKLMTVNAGTLALPADFVVSYDEADEAMLAEMNRFVATYNAATGAQATVAQNRADALFVVANQNIIHSLFSFYDLLSIYYLFNL